MAELAALAASAALAAMLFASRLPPGMDFFLPRRGGFGLYRAAWALFAAPGARTAFSAAVALALLACAAALAADLRRALREAPKTWSARLGLAIGPAFALLLAARLGGIALDLVQLVWFPYGGMNAWEPFAAFALFALALVPAAAAARDWVGGRRRRATVLFGGLVLLQIAGAVYGGAKGVGRALSAPAAHGRTVYVVLTEGQKGPDHDIYSLEHDVFLDPDQRPYYRALAQGEHDARVLPALRALYEAETKRWDLAGLRDALLLGVSRGDALATSLLLAHLTAVPPSPEARAALGAVADERTWRIGPLGAAALARACARQGDVQAAARWAAKSGGPNGVAPGLLGLPASGGKPGSIRGILRAPGPARLALYARQDPAAPYLLDAAGLVASAEPDARGRFAFTGLPPGRYYLALAVSNGDGRRGEVSVTGGRGDLILDARRPALDLPPLTLTFTPR